MVDECSRRRQRLSVRCGDCGGGRVGRYYRYKRREERNIIDHRHANTGRVGGCLACGNDDSGWPDPQATATTLDANDNVLTGRVVTWSSGNTSVATVSSSGVVTATGVGATTIIATSEGKSGRRSTHG